MDTYVLKEKNNKTYVSKTMFINNTSSLKVIDHPIRLKILKMLAKTPMYPAQIAKEINMHEQKVYYHIKQMTKSGVLDVVEREEIRGTVAKKLSPKFLNFSFVLSQDWTEFDKFMENKDKDITEFLSPFIINKKLNANIVVGSPDPHGPHKARARDGHYAIELALFLGKHSNTQENFSTKLDVDVNLKESKNLILVGGPVTNLLVSKLNEFLPTSFSDKKPWGIKTKLQSYTEESVGLIARIPNPYNPEYHILILAGIRFIGTKAAVFALTKHTKEVIHRYSGQKQFYAIVQGFDLDGDGKIDSIEVLE